MSQLRRTVQMRERVVEACRLVESRRNVRGVHIVAGGHPTGDEIRQYQDYAAGHHVDLTVDSHGMISIRPGAGEDA
jgi:hypothetical protein